MSTYYVVGVEQALSVFLLRRLHLTPVGCCLMVIMNETQRNLENTTHSVLSAILFIYGFQVEKCGFIVCQN